MHAISVITAYRYITTVVSTERHINLSKLYHVHISNKNPLQTLLASSLNRQQHHRHKRNQQQRSRSIDRRTGVGRSIDTNDRSTETSNTVQATSNTRTGTAVGSWEDLGGVSVQHTVHDHLGEGFESRADELSVGCLGGREAEEQDGSDQRRQRHCTFPTDVLEVDHVAGQNGAEESGHGGDSVVTVGDVYGRRGAEVLRQEGVEEGVSHADSSPAEPDEGG